MTSVADCFLVGIAAFGAGTVNAVAGGGTLISFPVLVALGVPAVSANVTNTVALCPGYLGGAVAQRRDLASQAHRVRSLLTVAGVGGLSGSVLLVNSSETLFRGMVPFLILGACVLLGVQERVKRWLVERGRFAVPDNQSPTLAVKAAVFGAAVYGGYFGAGLGIMLLAVLGLALDDSLIRVNALKQAVSLVVNVLAACFFVFSGRVHWTFAVIMAVTSLLGGSVGGRVVRRFKPALLRSVVVVFGVVMAVRFLV